MNRSILSIVVFISCCCAFFADAEVIEIQHFEEIASHIKPETLVILDIDDTLLIPEQMLGCDEWFLYQVKKNQQLYDNPERAFERTLAEFEAIRHLSAMRLVEENTGLIVKALQDKGVFVMCLTTQGLGLATRTVQQLKAHGIDPCLTAPFLKDCFFTIKGHGVLYRHGILFTSGTHKGEALFKLCEKINFVPLHILFINDKKSHLEEIARAAEAKSVEFIGLRYAYADLHKRAFRPEIAEIQFKRSSFDHILSDEEARLHLEPNGSTLLHRLRNPIAPGFP